MVPDTFKKTVRIPVRFVGGDFKFFYGGDLPAMREGTIGELIVPEYSVTDKYKLGLISKKFTKTFLPKGAPLLARLSEKSVDQSGKFLKRIRVSPLKGGLFAEIVLDAELSIEFSGTKSSELLDCTCRIPALPKAEARSVNHTDTLLPEKFDSRQSAETMTPPSPPYDKHGSAVKLISSYP